MCKISKSVAVAFLIGLTSVTSAYAGVRDTNTSKVAQKALPSIVRIAIPLTYKGEGIMDVIGSGIAIDSRGYILTNYHVVDGSANIFVGRYEQTKWYEAKLIFSDKGEDLAVLKIDAKLPELQLGPSSDLQVGEPAIVIGNPLDETFTVTQGIISKLRVLFQRENEDKEMINRWLIQTDAAVNPGNSGGALLNALGEVAGVVELKKGTSGLAWAITADRAQRVVSQHMSAKNMAEVEHGVSGLELKVLSKEGTGAERQGVFVTKLVKDGPAENVLRQGDRVLKVENRVIINQFDFERSFWDHKPGDNVEMTIVRDGTEQKVTITLTGDGLSPLNKD